jgi:hypothetical protein
LGLVGKFDAFPQMLSLDRIVAEDQKNNWDVPVLGYLSYLDEIFSITLRWNSGRKGAKVLDNLPHTRLIPSLNKPQPCEYTSQPFGDV